MAGGLNVEMSGNETLDVANYLTLSLAVIFYYPDIPSSLRNLTISSARNVSRECLWLAPQTSYEAKNWSAFASCRAPNEKRTIAAPIGLPRVFPTPSIGLSPRALAGSRPNLAFSSAAARCS